MAIYFDCGFDIGSVSLKLNPITPRFRLYSINSQQATIIKSKTLEFDQSVVIV